MISAWAVGSWRSSRSLWAAAISSPPRATTAPIGTSSCSGARCASRKARRMKYSSRGKKRSRIALPAAHHRLRRRCRRRSATSVGRTHHHYRGTRFPPTARSQNSCMRDRRLTALAAWAAPLIACLLLASSAAGSYAPGEVLVGHAGSTERVPVPPGASIAATVARLRREPGVRWAVPDYVAHAAGGLVPNDPGTGPAPGDWQTLQWNFSGPFGVNAPQAWANVASEGAPGGRRVVVAVLDTGVAYANRGPFRRSPDFSRYGFVQGYDFIARNHYPNDRNGHGTVVAGTIAEATNKRDGLTGLAFAARVMPVRVLDGAGEGDASVIAEGVRFAVRHGARVINLSLEFSSDCLL